MIKLNLPLPPSVNNAYYNVPGRGRVPSKAHREWKIEAGWDVKFSLMKRCVVGDVVVSEPKKKITGPYRFTILVPVNVRGDIDNRVKLASDLLVKLGVTPDDKHAVSSHVDRSADVPSGRCIVIVEAA